MAITTCFWYWWEYGIWHWVLAGWPGKQWKDYEYGLGNPSSVHPDFIDQTHFLQVKMLLIKDPEWDVVFWVSLWMLWEKAMAPHSSTLAWKIPCMEEPGRLQSMGSWRVGHNWATSLLLFTFMRWRRKWQPTPVFFSGESQGRGSLVGLLSVGLHRVKHDWSDLIVVVVVVGVVWDQVLFSEFWAEHRV